MRTRKVIEKEVKNAVQPALGTHLLLEVLLDIREQQDEIRRRLADAQTNRDPFHVTREQG